MSVTLSLYWYPKEAKTPENRLSTALYNGDDVVNPNIIFIFFLPTDPEKNPILPVEQQNKLVSLYVENIDCVYVVGVKHSTTSSRKPKPGSSGWQLPVEEYLIEHNFLPTGWTW